MPKTHDWPADRVNRSAGSLFRFLSLLRDRGWPNPGAVVLVWLMAAPFLKAWEEEVRVDPTLASGNHQ
jgi:hypothetical protein